MLSAAGSGTEDNDTESSMLIVSKAAMRAGTSRNDFLSSRTPEKDLRKLEGDT
jgi:hypothetical protein